MLDKYLIKRYDVSLIFTQYVLCENARLVSTMILFGSLKMVSNFFEVSRTPNVNSFFFDFLAKKIK
jgi:hypothetical protein